MTDEERARLADSLRAARLARDLTAREVARRAGVDIAVVTRLERQEIGQPRVESVSAIARVLGIPLSDIYTLLHWLPADELPTLRPYMRAKYEALPDEAVDEVERFIEELTRKHRHGPIDGEDEKEVNETEGRN